MYIYLSFVFPQFPINVIAYPRLCKSKFYLLDILAQRLGNFSNKNVYIAFETINHLEMRKKRTLNLTPLFSSKQKTHKKDTMLKGLKYSAGS